MEDKQDKNIKEILLDISKKLEEKEKPKKFKIPYAGRVNNPQAKKGYVTVMRIGNNRQVSFTKMPIDEQTIMLDDTPRIATTDEIIYYKNKPMIILPDWTVKPFSPSDNYDDTIKQNYASQGYKLLLNRMKREVIAPKKSIPMVYIIIGLLVLCAVGYFAWKGGLF